MAVISNPKIVITAEQLMSEVPETAAVPLDAHEKDESVSRYVSTWLKNKGHQTFLVLSRGVISGLLIYIGTAFFGNPQQQQMPIALKPIILLTSLILTFFIFERAQLSLYKPKMRLDLKFSSLLVGCSLILSILQEYVARASEHIGLSDAFDQGIYPFSESLGTNEDFISKIVGSSAIPLSIFNAVELVVYFVVLVRFLRLDSLGIHVVIAGFGIFIFTVLLHLAFGTNSASLEYGLLIGFLVSGVMHFLSRERQLLILKSANGNSQIFELHGDRSLEYIRGKTALSDTISDNEKANVRIFWSGNYLYIESLKSNVSIGADGKFGELLKLVEGSTIQIATQKYKVEIVKKKELR